MMTAGQQHREEQHAAVMAVAHALTAAEREEFLARTRTWPGMDGAEVADVLAMTVDHDKFLNNTEPFFERFGGQMPEEAAVIYALHALIILNRALVPGPVIALLQRAGCLDAPRYPEVEAGLWVSEGTSGGCANALTVMTRAARALRAAGVPEEELTEFRGSVRRTDLPGYSRDLRDVAAWVTLVNGYVEPAAPAPYSPVHDLAVVVMFAELHSRVLQPDLSASPVAQALANLRAHVGLASVEEAEAHLAVLFEGMGRAQALKTLGGQ